MHFIVLQAFCAQSLYHWCFIHFASMGNIMCYNCAPWQGTAVALLILRAALHYLYCGIIVFAICVIIFSSFGLLFRPDLTLEVQARYYII